jgi:hypothetical protein
MQRMWIFMGEGARHPSGVFTERETAERWIGAYQLSGVLTAYPVDVGAYDWAIDAGHLRPKEPGDARSQFVGRFSSAYLEHYHYDGGRRSDADAPHAAAHTQDTLPSGI